MIQQLEQPTSQAECASRIATCDASLRIAGAICTHVSEAGSRYFNLRDGRHIRVADHAASLVANEDRWAAEIRVESPRWREQLNSLTGIPEPTAIDLPSSVYFGDHGAVSQSMLKVFADRRRLYQAYFIEHSLPEKEDTDPMRKGTATHTALLEPHRFERIVVTYPSHLLAKNGAVSTTEAKKFRDDQEAQGRIALKEADAAKVRAMADSVRSVCGDWLDLPGVKEKALYWQDEFTGLILKMRLDWLVTAQGNVCFDLKTTTDASPREFRKRCEQMLYALQAVHYIDGIEQCYHETPTFYFIAVESEPPYACAIHEIDEGSLSEARGFRNRLLRDLNACLASENFAEPWERRINRLSINPYRYSQE